MVLGNKEYNGWNLFLKSRKGRDTIFVECRKGILWNRQHTDTLISRKQKQ